MGTHLILAFQLLIFVITKTREEREGRKEGEKKRGRWGEGGGSKNTATEFVN